MNEHHVDIAANLQRVRASIRQAAEAAGRDHHDIRLIAVSKTMPIDAIQAAYAAGQRDFGENKLQELASKQPLLPADICWHMIGHLQSNKTRQAAGIADLIHGVDREKLIRRLADAAEEQGTTQSILLQANVSGEASKDGVPPEALDRLLELALEHPSIMVKGLMTMAPFEAPEEQLHAIFAALRETRDRLAAAFAVPLPELSMGMSADYRIAIAEGATMVRVGTAIFGHRDNP